MKFRSYIVIVTCISLSGCLDTEGTIDIRGKVLDEKTRIIIPQRTIIVQGIVESYPAGGNKKIVQVDAGQFSTDSLGYFTYTLKKVKDAYFYNFCIVGDSTYAFSTTKFGLWEIMDNAKFLSFSLSKLADFNISIERKTKTPACDTIYLSWESNEIDGKILYPDKIENYGIPPDLIYRWIGGNVKSVIRTKAYADKETKISFVLYRNGKKKEFSNTIFCTRDIINYANFTY